MDAQVKTATPYLETLNPEQRRAVEHGAAGGLAAPPLLVIAGAGSGKTNTLAHRVAHLIVQGADPRRILLMTFSRRAASEMTKRVERIARKVMGDNAGVMTDALTWAGTYHGIGARLLREYAEQIGVSPAAKNFYGQARAQYLAFIHLYTRLHHRPGPRKPTCKNIFASPTLRSSDAADAETGEFQGSPAASNSSLILSSFQSYFDPEFNRSNSPCSGTR
jgi:superfamily I DNA/RNA helicase